MYARLELVLHRLNPSPNFSDVPCSFVSVSFILHQCGQMIQQFALTHMTDLFHFICEKTPFVLPAFLSLNPFYCITICGYMYNR